MSLDVVFCLFVVHTAVLGGVGLLVYRLGKLGEIFIEAWRDTQAELAALERSTHEVLENQAILSNGKVGR